jgi:hypothetical protein
LDWIVCKKAKSTYFGINSSSKEFIGMFFENFIMNDKQILRIALVCSMAGLIALYIVSLNISPDTLSPATDFSEKQYVSFNGTIEKISAGKGVYYLKISYSSETDAVVFSKDDLPFEEGDKIEITGKTDSFSGKDQIIADRIKVIG